MLHATACWHYSSNVSTPQCSSPREVSNTLWVDPRSLYWLPGITSPPTMYCSHTLRGVWSILLPCMRTRSVCTGVALPFLVPRTPQVLILLMAALMIPGIKMLAIGVMTHNHDLGDHGCRSSCCSCIVQGLCTLLHSIALLLLWSTMHAVWLHTFLLLFSNGCTHDPGITRLAIWCNDPQP